ncbi:hypothetical protein [Ideonella paludis]|uniref:Uncharacterized protein n=1 Tax=Ideonella paludis TaxID=1233411 RepID=A0ABS5DY49_9BURK|nr:hypothetical protein [Ideonella paludis]MBQ0936071.1 hypothetical protein [Ideonella paludis]
MQLIEHRSPDGVDPWVSLRFDLDFYKTPTGKAFLITSNGSRPLYLREFGVAYHWDDSLVVAYHSKPCSWMPPLREQHCSPLNYLSHDRRMQVVVRSVLDQPEVARRRIKEVGTQLKSSASSGGLGHRQW